MLEPEWTGQDEAEARRAGWYLYFGCNGTRIRALDCAGIFENDSAAVTAVAYRAVLGDMLAIRALKYLVHDNGLDEHPYLVGEPLSGQAGPIAISGKAGDRSDRPF